MALIAQLPQRPSDIVGLKGSAVERLLFDMEILSKVPPPDIPKIPPLPKTSVPAYKGKGSVRDKILARRRRMGII